QIFEYTRAITHFYFGIYYDLVWVKFPSTLMRGGFFDYISRFKYLTFWNMIVQAVYFTICLVNDICGNTDIDPKEKPLIRRIKDYMYATVAFPVSMFVGIQFWILMFIDRELVLPKAMDPFFPSWLNHIMHTNIMIFTLIEMVTTFQQYPKRSDGLKGLVSFMLIYLIWLHVIYGVSSFWVYPILEVLNAWQRLLFFLFTLGLVVSLYFLGEFLNNTIWGKVHRQLEITKARRKTK
ncbi:hypothetical protein L9F63_015432, partial [Diploptera punctata]